MKHNPRNLPYHELIGLRIKILLHTDPALVNREGIVIWETMKTLIIRDLKSNKEIIVMKENGVFEFELPSGKKVVIEGSRILGRPEDRVKKLRY